MDSLPAAFLVAVDSVSDLLALPAVASAWTSPSALPEWSGGGLSAHLAAQAFLAVGRLEDPPGGDPITLDEHYHRAAWVNSGVQAEANVGIRAGGEREAAEGPAALLARLHQARSRLDPLLAGSTADQPLLLPWQGWSLTRDDFLVTRMMEIAVHSDDLAVSVGISAPDLPDSVLTPLLALLTRLAVRRHGQGAVLAALTRAERAPTAINAF
jgi:hypothetical protein